MRCPKCNSSNMYPSFMGMMYVCMSCSGIVDATGQAPLPEPPAPVRSATTLSRNEQEFQTSVDEWLEVVKRRLEGRDTNNLVREPLYFKIANRAYLKLMAGEI